MSFYPWEKANPRGPSGMGPTAHLKPPRLSSILKQKTTQTTKAGRIRKTHGTISKEKSNKASKSPQVSVPSQAVAKDLSLGLYIKIAAQ